MSLRTASGGRLRRRAPIGDHAARAGRPDRPAPPREGAAGGPAALRRSAVPRVVEAAALAVAPLVCFWGLRLRAMAPTILPDPVMHSVYMWDPRDLVVRYVPRVISPSLRAYIGPPAAYFRWGTRPGLLVPGRLAYLLFGAVPGFFALRYVLALVAIVPVYLLAKRHWGAWAGVLGVVLILSSPVVVTAWGTDFPDSAAVSYLLGGLACLALGPRTPRGRRVSLAVAAVLLTAAVWALATTGLVVAVALIAWAVLQPREERARLRADVGLLAGAAVAATLGLAVASWILLGRFDYVVPTIQALRFLATPAQAALWHSSSPAWAPYDAYLLVLPAVSLAWAAVMILRPESRRRGPLVLLGLGATLQLAVAALGQFASHIQVLENHYLSSTLWPLVLLTLLAVLAELAAPLAGHRALRFAPAALVVAVALASEALPTPAPFLWAPVGYLLVALVVAAVVAGLLLARLPAHSASAGPRPVNAPHRSTVARRAGALVAVTAVLGGLLVLTVDPSPSHAALPNTVFDPATGYDGALGGSAAPFLDTYRIAYRARRWVPNATYPGEQLMTCFANRDQVGLSVIGLFHSGDNLLPGACPALGGSALATIRRRRVAQVLVVAARPLGLRALLRRLAPFDPSVAGHIELRAGTQHGWLALIDLRRYLDAHAV